MTDLRRVAGAVTQIVLEGGALLVAGLEVIVWDHWDRGAFFMALAAVYVAQDVRRQVTP